MLLLSLPILLSQAIGDPTTVEVVWRELYFHPVSREDPDEVPSHLARHVSQDPVPVLELNAKRRIGQRLDDDTLHLNGFFFGQNPAVSVS